MPTENDTSKEQRILLVMRKLLGSIVRETTPSPGMKHMLSEHTREDIRMCLYSGEIYRGPYPKTDVAENNIAGLSSGIQALKASGGSEEFALVEFETEVFRRFLE